MNFEKAVGAVPKKNALKRIASAHVRDYRGMNSDRLCKSILETKNQYTHPESVEKALEAALYTNDDLMQRVLSSLIIRDVLLNEYEHIVGKNELVERIQEIEQDTVKEANESTLKDIAGDTQDSPHYKNLALYKFVLEVAWQHRDTKSVDESNLLFKLRNKLRVTRREHRVMEAKLGKYPKNENKLHSHREIETTVRELEKLGLVMEVRDDSGKDFVVIPQEVVAVIKDVLGVEMRREGYMELLKHKAVRQKSYLKGVLDDEEIPYPTRATRAELQERVAETVSPSVVLGGRTLVGGLNNEDLREWCSDLGLQVTGTKDERIERIIDHYDQLELKPVSDGDERERWYYFYDALAERDLDTLRSQHVIQKDCEIDNYFEEATKYLFEAKLNLTPMRQAGSEHSDGLLSFQDKFVMWDNKSSGAPVRLKSHIRQFDSYMDNAEKDVPIFLVIGPEFTEESEAEALKYTANNFGRNIVMVKASDLKELAELWSSEENTNSSDAFPLGLLARPGLLSLESVRASIE